MHASFEEKSVWIQLIGTGVGLGAYFAIAGTMLRNGVTELPAYVPLFVIAVILIVIINAVGHAVVAIVSRKEGQDERDRLIGWRAESNAAWILGVGVLLAITGLLLAVENVWVAHLLLLSLFLAEVVKQVMQLVYYRRGI